MLYSFWEGGKGFLPFLFGKLSTKWYSHKFLLDQRENEDACP